MTLRRFQVLIASPRRTVLPVNTDAKTFSPMKLIASMNLDIDARATKSIFRKYTVWVLTSLTSAGNLDESFAGILSEGLFIIVCDNTMY
ncbi:MAG TPA: hypothetical protein VFV86_05085 [Nitrososphaeraceae archaeon]|nr:hypothetical protein [Nitrososphaeraceae archaeon]